MAGWLIAAVSLVSTTLVADASTAALPGSAVNVRDSAIGAKGDGKTDDTAAIQTAIDRYHRVYLPQGVYRIDPRVGLVVRTGTQLVGDGPSATLLLASPGGGTTAQLTSYGPGSIIRRRFNPLGKNDYVTNVRITDLAVIMTHPADRVTTNEIQIGIDLRNISRSLVERVHVGNLLPAGNVSTRSFSPVFASQGYGIVFGTVSSGDRAYAGGEVNTARDVSVWGAYKLLAHDDAVISPNSAAHATLVDRADLQTGHYLISQESRYTHGVTWRSLVLQNVVPQYGNHDPAMVARIYGQHNWIDGGYVEASSSALYLVDLSSTARGNKIMFQSVSMGAHTRIRDRGIGNSVSPVVGLNFERE